MKNILYLFICILTCVTAKESETDSKRDKKICESFIVFVLIFVVVKFDNFKHQVSISSTFCVRLLHTESQKA